MAQALALSNTWVNQRATVSWALLANISGRPLCALVGAYPCS